MRCLIMILSLMSALIYLDLYASDVKIQGPSYIEYKGANPTGGSWLYRFKNRGPQKVYITVCLQEGAKERKQYQSSVRVPVNGSYKIRSFESTIQDTIVVAANPSVKPVIAGCGSI